MSKRTISLIIALFIITVALLAVALSTSKNKSTQVAMQPTPTPFAQSVLSFSPSVVSVPTTAATPQTVNVLLNSNMNDVTGVQLELSYDPQVLSNVSIANGTMFANPLVLRQKIDPISGTVDYVYAITPAQQSQKGSGEVAVLSFTPNRNALVNGKPVTQTQIKLLPKSEISARGVDKSVLNTSSLRDVITVSFTTTGASATATAK